MILSEIIIILEKITYNTFSWFWFEINVLVQNNRYNYKLLKQLMLNLRWIISLAWVVLYQFVLNEWMRNERSEKGWEGIGKVEEL